MASTRMGILNADIIKLANYRIFKMHKWQRPDKKLIIIIRVEVELEVQWNQIISMVAIKMDNGLKDQYS